MILRRIFSGSTDATVDPASEAIHIDAPDARARLTALYTLQAPSWLRLNLIANVNGSVIGSDGTSDTLSNRADRKLLGVIRRDSDVVLVGASSVRAEGYRLPATVPLAVVTGSGNLAGHRLTSQVEAGRLLVLCPKRAVDTALRTLAGAEATIVVIDDIDGRLAPAAIIAALRERGLDRVVCEGGPELATQLVAAGLVDELCLSTSPQIGGASLPMLAGIREVVELELVQLLADDGGGLYARWRPVSPG